MDYSPFNPVVWVFFLGGLALVILGVKIYHRYYPNYPRELETLEDSSFEKALASENPKFSGNGVSTVGIRQQKNRRTPEIMRSHRND